MQEYNSASDYLSAIKQEIKWKCARTVATQEIADHISDQCDALLRDGIGDKEALNKTLIDLGDAREIGKNLNKLHRPRTNWPLIVFTALILCAGFAAQYIFANIRFFPLIASVVIGVVIMLIMYSLDYTVLIRFPKIIFFSLLVLTLFALIYDLRNGFTAISYSYTYYLVLLFPIVNIGVAFQIKESNTEPGLLFAFMYLIPELVISSLISSVPAFMYILISAIFLFAYTLKNKWFTFNRASIIGIVCLITIVVLGLLYVDTLTNMWHSFFSYKDNFLSEQARQVICNTPVLGSSTDSVDLFNGTPEYILLRVAMKCGTIVFWLSFIIYGVVSFLMFRIVSKQTSFFGTLVSGMILMEFFMQFMLSFIGNLGLINGQYIMPLPLASSGGVYNIFNLFLVGIMLSVYRFEDIAKDRIRLKSREKKGGDLI